MIKMTGSFVRSVGQRKILSPRWDPNAWPPRYWLGALNFTELQETLGEQSHLLASYVTRVVHIAVISNVESIVCVRNNEDVQFYARRINDKDDMFICHELIPRRESNPWPSRYRLGALMLTSFICDTHPAYY